MIRVYPKGTGFRHKASPFHRYSVVTSGFGVPVDSSAPPPTYTVIPCPALGITPHDFRNQFPVVPRSAATTASVQVVKHYHFKKNATTANYFDLLVDTSTFDYVTDGTFFGQTIDPRTSDNECRISVPSGYKLYVLLKGSRVAYAVAPGPLESQSWDDSGVIVQLTGNWTMGSFGAFDLSIVPTFANDGSFFTTSTEILAGPHDMSLPIFFFGNQALP